MLFNHLVFVSCFYYWMEGRVRSVCSSGWMLWLFKSATFWLLLEKPSLIFASCHELRICTETHTVEEKVCVGPFGSCDVDGQGVLSGKPSYLLLTVVHSNESVPRMHRPSVARVKGPPEVAFLLGGASLVNSWAHSNHGQCPLARCLCLTSGSVVSETAIRSK